MQVIKRDGRVVDFNKDKIKDAVLKAFMDVDKELTLYAKDKSRDIANYVESSCGENNYSVEEIQDIVEEKLMASNRKDVAKAYILYRNDRNRAREKNSELIKNVQKKLSASDVQNQNANVDEKSFGGRVGEANDVVMKQLALDFYMSEVARYNHINNRSYTHDLNSYAVGSHNCMSIPFDDLLKHGFNTRQTDVRPAQSVNTACQLIAVIFQLQSLQQFGGVSATHLDWTLVPYVRKSFFKHYTVAYLKSTKMFVGLNLLDMLFSTYTDDFGIVRNKFDDWVDLHKQDLLSKYNLKESDFVFENKDKLDASFYQSAMYDTIMEVKQACEAMYHNLNTLQSRSGNQLPFTSINYGTCTSEEGRLVIKALLDASIKGIGSLHKTSIFPCGIFQCMKGVNQEPGEPNYDMFQLALYSTATRLYPNYANVDWSGNAGYDRNDPRTYFSTINKTVA